MEQLQVNSPVSAGGRAEHLGEHFPEQSASLDRLLTIARRGLASAYVPESQQFVQTVRSARTSHGVEAQPTSTSLRYTAMAGLGLSRLPEAEQRTVLAGDLAVDVLARAAERAESSQ